MHLQGLVENQANMEALIHASGAQLLARSPPDTAELPVVKELQQGLVCPKVVVLHSQASPTIAAGPGSGSKVAHLRCDWLLDSAAAWEIQDYDKYRVAL